MQNDSKNAVGAISVRQGSCSTGPHLIRAWHSSINLSIVSRKVDIRLPGKGDSDSLGVRGFSIIQWIRTSSLPIKNSLSRQVGTHGAADMLVLAPDGDLCRES